MFALTGQKRVPRVRVASTRPWGDNDERVNTTAFLACLVIGVLWWLWFALSGVHLRRKGRPVEVGFMDRRTLALLTVQVAAAVAVYALDGEGLIVLAFLVASPRVAAAVGTVERVRARRRDRLRGAGQ